MNRLLLITSCIQVVSHILWFLDLPDRKSAAEVCRSWYYASLDHMLASDVVLTFPSWSEFHAALPQLCQRSRINLVLESIDNSIVTRNQVAGLGDNKFSERSFDILLFLLLTDIFALFANQLKLFSLKYSLTYWYLFSVVKSTVLVYK